MKKIIAMTGLMTIVYFTALFIYTPNLSIYAESLGATVTMVGLLGGIYGLLQVILRIPLGIISDKINKRKIFIIVGMGISVISSVVLYLAETPEGLLLGRALPGASQAAWVIIITLFVSYYEPENASKAMGIILACATIGQMIGTSAGGLIYAHLGEKVPFLISIIGAAAAFILSFFIKDAPKSYEKKPAVKGELFKVGKQKNVLIYSIVTGIMHFVMFATIMTFTPVIASGIGAGGAEIGLMVFAYTATGVIASLMMGNVIKDRHEIPMTVIGMLLMVVSTALTPFAGSVAALCILQVVGGFGRGFAFSCLSARTVKSVPPEKSATATGLLQAVLAVGIFLGPILTGFLIDNLPRGIGMTIAYMALAVISLVGALITFLAMRKGITKTIYQNGVKPGNEPSAV
ncbi:MAG: MFS transporter [Christensenellales bacterium]